MGLNGALWGGFSVPAMSSPAKPFYTGLFRHALDDKNRLTIPSAWRAAHVEGEVFLATPHPDGYIAVLPPAEVEKLQDFAARFFAETQTLAFDKAGRVMVNAELLARAGIVKDAVLVGSLTKFSFYSPERWERVKDRTSGDNFGDLMRRLGI